MVSDNCECNLQPAPVRDTVKRVLINSHLRDTIVEGKRSRYYNDVEKKLPIPQDRYFGIYTQTRSILNPPTPSRFDQFTTMVRESVYKSNRDEQLGLPRRAWSKPPEVNIISRTFGCASNSNERLYPLVLPPDTPKEVQLEWKTRDISGRRRYDYNERFDRQHCFGKYYNTNVSGRCTDRCLHWIYHPGNVCVMSSIQGLVRDRTWAPDGEVLEPCKNRLCVPTDHTYGRPTKASGECVASEIYEGVAHLNRQRLQLKKRLGGVNFASILQVLKKIDEKNIGYLPKEAVYLILQKFYIRANYEVLEKLLQTLNILTCNGLIDYSKLVNIFDINTSYPELYKIIDVPAEHLHYITTYEDLVADRLKPNQNTRPTPLNMHDCDKTHIINPSSCEQFGLHRIDYTRGRTKECIHDIFESSGFCIKDFEDIWSRSVAIDAHLKGLCSVQTFCDVLEGVQ